MACEYGPGDYLYDTNQVCGSDEEGCLYWACDKTCSSRTNYGFQGAYEAYVDDNGVCCNIYNIGGSFDICNGTCTDSSACGEEVLGCQYSDIDDNCCIDSDKDNYWGPFPQVQGYGRCLYVGNTQVYDKNEATCASGSLDAQGYCYGTCNSSSACGENSSGCLYTNCDQTCTSTVENPDCETPDPSGVSCLPTQKDALGYCNGDAILDCAGNYYSPSNEDGGAYTLTDPCTRCAILSQTSISNYNLNYPYYCPSCAGGADVCGNCNTACTGNVCDCGCGSGNSSGLSGAYWEPSVDGTTITGWSFYDVYCDQVPNEPRDALGVLYGTCADATACGEDANGCIYRNPNQTCIRPLVFTNAYSDNLSDARNWSGGILPTSTDNVRIEGFVYQDVDELGEAGFASVYVAQNGLIWDGITISTNHRSNNSQFTGGYAEKYFTNGVFDSTINGLYNNLYPPTGYALFINGTTNNFFTGGFDGVYYVLGVVNTTFNGTAQNYSVVNGVVVSSSATFVNGVIANTPDTSATDLIYGLIGIPWMVFRPNVGRIIGLPPFIKL